MKVAFVYPGIVCTGYNSYTTLLGEGESLPIYGISLLAGIVKARGHEVELLDLRQLASEDDLIARLRASSCDVVAVTVQTPSFNIACRVAEIAKRFGKVTLAGGIHATVAPEDFDRPCWDHVVKGDGEIALPDLLDALDKGESAPRLIEGTVCDDLDSLPLPHYFPEWLPNYRQWYGIEAARGCFGRCTYCVSGQRKYYRKMRFRSNAHVLREIDHAYRLFRFTHLAFLDVNATAHRRRFNDLLRTLADRYPELQVGIQDRSDTFNEETAELLSRFKGGGLVWFGFESGSPRMLEFIHKDFDVSQAKAALDLCKKHRLKTAAMMIIGIPTETEEDIQQTYDLVKYARPDILAVNIMSPFPGTPLFDYCRDNGLFPENMTHERFHIRKIFERGLLKGVDYDRVRYWQKRIHGLASLDAEARDRIEAIVTRAVKARRKVGVFGAGAHTEGLLASTRISEAGPVLFDNDIRKWGDTMVGFDILPPSRIPDAGVDCVVISTKAHEEAVFQQLQGMNLNGVEVVRLYA